MSNVSMIDGHIDRYKEMTSKEIIDGFCYCLDNSVCDGCVLKGEICDASLPNKIEVLKMVSKVLCSQQAEIENLNNFLYDAEGVNLVNYWYQQCEIAENGCRNLEEENKKLKAEIERLQADKEALINGQLTLQKDITFKHLQINNLKKIRCRKDEELSEQMSLIKVLDQKLDTAKSEAIKEFAERLKLKVDIDLCEAIECSDYLYNLPKLIDNLVKEMVGEDK